jgi:hypothetical protein
MRSSSVYIGFDVACAVGRALPICVVSPEAPIDAHTRGIGNRAAAFARSYHATKRPVMRDGLLCRLEAADTAREQKEAADHGEKRIRQPSPSASEGRAKGLATISGIGRGR